MGKEENRNMLMEFVEFLIEQGSLDEDVITLMDKQAYNDMIDEFLERYNYGDDNE